VCASAAVIGTAIASPLAAQIAPSLEGDNLVLNRPRPGLDPVGLKLGGLTIVPSLDGTVAYDDNIYLTAHNKVHSPVLSVTPSLVATSNWSRHALSFNAGATVERYTNRHTEDNERYRVEGTGLLDVLNGIQLTGGGHYIRSIESRGTAGDILATGEPVRFSNGGGTVGLVANFTNLKLTLGGEIDRFEYSDIRVGDQRFSQAYRDHDYRSASATLSYTLSPAIQPFVQVLQERERYDVRDRNTTLDSKGTIAVGGINVSLTKLLTGRAAIGYRWRNYRNPNFVDTHGLSYDLALVWNPRTLVSVTVAAQKTVDESPNTIASGIIRNQASGQVDYELLRRVIVSGSVKYSVERYRGIDRTDHRTISTASARYLVNRFMRLDLKYEHASQNGNGLFGRSYAGNTVGLSLTLQR
jgi:hypothetical protein